MYIVNKRWLLQGRNLMKESIFGTLRLYFKRFHFTYVTFMAAKYQIDIYIYVTFIRRWRSSWGIS